MLLGLAIATKLTAMSFLIMPAIGYFAGLSRPASIRSAVRTVIVFLAGCAFVTLVASPYYLLDWNVVASNSRAIPGAERRVQAGLHLAVHRYDPVLV